MTYKTHIAGGFLLASAAQTIPGLLQPEATQAGIMLVTAISSLLPDIDDMNSYLSNRNILFKIFGFFVKHRTITHCLAFVVACGLLANSLIPEYTFHVVLGIGSHLLMDAFNPLGVPLFYPLTDKHFHIPLIRICYGGIGEAGLLLGCVFLTAKLHHWI